MALEMGSTRQRHWGGYLVRAQSLLLGWDLPVLSAGEEDCSHGRRNGRVRKRPLQPGAFYKAQISHGLITFPKAHFSPWFFETRFHCVDLAVLELTL